MKMLNGVVVILRLFGGAARAWWDDDAPRLGASLAYYTLFAIAPILLVATAIAGSSRDQGNLNGAFGRSWGCPQQHIRRRRILSAWKAHV